jgi:uncharacterized protein
MIGGRSPKSPVIGQRKILATRKSFFQLFLQPYPRLWDFSGEAGSFGVPAQIHHPCNWGGSPESESPMKPVLTTLCALMCIGTASANITVTGNGKVVYAPDTGTLVVGVSSEGKTAAEAWNKNREAVNKLFEVLKKQGILPKDMKTSNLAVTPRYVEKDKKQLLVGYVASYDLTVVVRKLDDLGTILDGMVENGANRNVNLTFGCSDTDKLMDQARTRAIAEARRKAETFVTGAGARLGHVVSISDGSVPVMYAPPMRFMYEAKADAAALIIAAGEQELSVSVTVAYEIDNSVPQ